MRALIAALLLAACAEPVVPIVHQVRFRVTADDESPVSGARVLVGDGKEAGETGGDGSLYVELRAPEGTRLPIEVVCPEGHGVAMPTTVWLRRHERLDGKTDEAPEVSTVCPRLNRTAAIVIRAGGRAGLPVMLLGREVARTDASGIAHLVMRMAPGATFRLTLDTSADPALRPKSPSVTFVIPEKDDVLVFDQPFEKIAPPPKRRRRPPPPPAEPDRPFAIVSGR